MSAVIVDSFGDCFSSGAISRIVMRIIVRAIRASIVKN